MHERSPTLTRVLRGELCTGCGLCAGISGGAIAMAELPPGYARPLQSAAVDDATEARIADACPGNRLARWHDAPHHHPYWGPYHRTMSGHATDPEVRHAGASGGALSGLLVHALETGLVDRVLHLEADPDRPTGNRIRWSHNRADILAGAGSRYAASSPLAAIDGARRIIRAMALDPDRITAFRYRGNGWPGLTVAETDTGQRATMTYADSWGRHLSREVQFRCKICPDAIGAVADIACADAWYGGESGYPTFEEQDGRSLIMSRTDAGEALLASAIAAGAIDADPLPVGEVDLMQPAQARRKRMVAARAAACRMLGKPVPDMRGTAVGAAARRGTVRETATNFIGTAKRIIEGRR
jgi:coenzyme F420 hydrogenase subunit beta